MSNLDIMIAAGSILGGAGAAISAWIAMISVRASNGAQTRANEQDKRHIWTEIQISAAKAAALFKSVERVATDLKLSYKTLFTFAGHGAQSSRLDAYLKRVDEELSEVRSAAESSQKISASFAHPSQLDYESAVDSRARLEASVVRLSLTLDLFKDELSGIARQNDQFRAEVMKSKQANS